LQVNVLDLQRPLLRALRDLQILSAPIETAKTNPQNSGQIAGTHFGGGQRDRFARSDAATRLIFGHFYFGKFLHKFIRTNIRHLSAPVK
jgi:hypothetical protein